MLLLIATISAAMAAPVSVGAGYYGDFVSHPGGYLSASWQVAEAGSFSARVGGELGAYHHERNHTGAFARGHMGLRATGDSGLFFEPRFVLGYVHTWVDGDEYWVVDEDTLELRGKYEGGSPNLGYGMGLGFGWDPKGDDQGLTWLMRAEATGRAPYNGFALNQFALLAGVEWTPGGGR